VEVNELDQAVAMPRLVDLSHTITEGLLTYPGLPAPHIFEHLDREAADGDRVGRGEATDAWRLR
jgi:hypothetical protein